MLILMQNKNGTPDANQWLWPRGHEYATGTFGNLAMLISLLEEVASFAAIFLFVTALAFWSNILSTI